MVITVTNRKLCKDCFAERVQKILSAEPFLVILREKDLSDSEYEKLAGNIISDKDKYRQILSLNRPGIAAKLGIENVHLTIHDLRENSRPEGIKRVGVSVHSADEAKEAQNLGADYLIAGHIYTTDCKKGVPPRGIDFLREVVSSVKIPVFAIGGICEENFREPLENGAKGVCLMSEFMTCDKPDERVKMYK
jgi:thiamine-phosphate pyrophosphorylase